MKFGENWRNLCMEKMLVYFPSPLGSDLLISFLVLVTNPYSFVDSLRRLFLMKWKLLEKTGKLCLMGLRKRVLTYWSAYFLNF